MKRLSKLFINLFAVLMLVVACLSFSACGKDIKTLQLKLEIYDYENNCTYAESDVEMNIDLYRHLAPNTVDKIIEYVNDGYYNDTVFYRIKDKSAQIMLGDLKYDGEDVTLNAIKPMLDGEFENGGTIGSNLKNVKGAIGLWRTWTAYDGDEYYKTSTSVDTGRSALYIPTNEITSYDSWFCVLGSLDLEDESTETALTAIIDAFGENGEYKEFEVYYTGEYDESKPNENFGLEFHCVPVADFDEDVEGLFEAEGTEYVCYNHYTIQIPVTGVSGKVATRVISAKVI